MIELPFEAWPTRTREFPEQSPVSPSLRAPSIFRRGELAGHPSLGGGEYPITGTYVNLGSASRQASPFPSL